MENTPPHFLPPIPEGYVYLGPSRAFKTTSRMFVGGFIAESSAYRGKTWNLSDNCLPSNVKIHYIAPKDSAIAQYNGIGVEIEHSLNGIDIPSFIPKIPKGYMYLGRGGSFNTNGCFPGASLDRTRGAWNCGQCLGAGRDYHYIAPIDSEVVKFNTNPSGNTFSTTILCQDNKLIDNMINTDKLLQDIEKAKKLIGKKVRIPNSDNPMVVRSFNFTYDSRSANHVIKVEGTKRVLLSEVEEVKDIIVGDYLAVEYSKDYYFMKAAVSIVILKKILAETKDFLAKADANTQVVIRGIAFAYGDLRKLNLSEKQSFQD